MQRHIQTRHALTPGIVHFHVCHELNTGSVPSFIRRHLKRSKDPLVVKAPFNPFTTHTQLWLSKHDPNYKPIFIQTQENLDELNFYPHPSYSQLDLDHPDEDPLADFLPTVGQEVDAAAAILLAATEDRTLPEEPVTIPSTTTLSSETGLLNPQVSQETTSPPLDTLFAQEFPSILDIPSTSTDQSMAFRTYSPVLDHITGYTIEPESDTSSDLEDFSELIRGPSPPATLSSTTLATVSSTTIASALNDAVDFDPDEFLRLIEQGPIYEDYIGITTPTQIQVRLNMNTNPHSNSVENPEPEEEVENNHLPDIPVTNIEPPGQFHIGLYDLYEPLREPFDDLTNLPVTR